jgi:rhodanese-related sulfurtransferase
VYRERKVDFAARAAKELDSGKPVLVYCRSGRRSAEAAAALAWEKAGQPIVKPE